MQTVASVLARLCFCAVFLGSGVNKIMNVPETVSEMQKYDIPMPGLLVYGAIAFLMVGGLSVLIGYKARFGAALLIVFLVMVNYYIHDFWNHPEDPMEMVAFLKNVALLGGALFIVANGPGVGSVDVCCCRPKGIETASDAENEG